MKVSLKRSAALILAGLTSVSMLSACGGTGSGSQAASQAGSTVQSAASGTQPSANTTHKLSMLTSDNDNKYIKFADREKYDSWQVFEKWLKEQNLEISFETVPSDQYKVVVQTRLASGSNLPDIVNISPVDQTTALNLAKQGTIVPINKLLKEHGDGSVEKFLENEAPFATKLTTASDGNIYWFSGIQKTTYNKKLASTCQMIAIRKDWLDKLGLKAPTNAQEFKDVLTQFREKDANGNGAKDEEIAVDASGFLTGVAQWFGMSPNLVSLDPVTKKITSPWYQKGAKEYFKYMNELAKAGLLETGVIGATTDDLMSQKISENKVGATVTYAMQKWLEPSIKGSATKAEYMPIGPLNAVEGITPISATEASTLLMATNFAVTKNCKDQDGVAKLLSIIYSDKYETLCSGGIEGVEYKTVNGIRETQPGYANAYWAQNAKDGKSSLDKLVGNVLPKLRFAQMETEINNPELEKSKADYQKKVIEYTPSVAYDPTSYLALPDTDQLAKQTELSTNLTTYSSELATKLILGQEPLDNWDQDMAKLKKLGLDDLIAIDQKLYEKYTNG